MPDMQQLEDGQWVPSVPMRRATWLEVMLDRWIGERTGHPWRSVLRGLWAAVVSGTPE